MNHQYRIVRRYFISVKILDKDNQLREYNTKYAVYTYDCTSACINYDEQLGRLVYVSVNILLLALRTTYAPRWIRALCTALSQIMSYNIRGRRLLIRDRLNIN